LKSKIRFGIIGCSSIAERTTIPAIIRAKNAVLQTIGSRDIDRAEKFAKKFLCRSHGTYDDVLNDKNVDAVYISLPIGLQEELVIKSAKAGKHIICEKSASVSFTDAEKMVKTCIDNKVRLLEGFAFRFHPQHKQIVKIIGRRLFGRTFTFMSKFLIPMKETPQNFRFRKELGGGALNDLGCYIICASRIMFNSNPVSVNCRLFQKTKNGVDSYGNILLQFADNQYAFGVFGYENGFQSNYEIISSNGAIKSEIAYNIKANKKPVINLWTRNEEKTLELSASNQSRLMIENFCDVLRHEKSPLFAYEKDLLYQAHIMEASRLSSSKNKIINIKGI
jgi:predicted dehydrogenase